jgi:Fic family protein
MTLIEERIHERILAKKKALDSCRPLSEAVVSKLRKQMEIEFTYNSNAIEGNTLTLRETQMVIREGFTVGGKSLNDHLEAKNHPKAIEYIEALAKRESIEKNLTEVEILKVHELIFSGIMESAGVYRNSQVYIEGCEQMPPPAFEVPQYMKELTDWLKKNPEELSPIELSSVFHHKLVSIHPFDDGNGRVSRLMANMILINHGYTLTVVKKVDRRKYYDTLAKADCGDLKPFVNFIARCVEQSLDVYLSAVEPSREDNKPLSLAEAAKFTPYSAEYLSLLSRKGSIGAVKRGRNWTVTLDALKRYADTQKSKKHLSTST